MTVSEQMAAVVTALHDVAWADGFDVGRNEEPSEGDASGARDDLLTAIAALEDQARLTALLDEIDALGGITQTWRDTDGRYRARAYQVSQDGRTDWHGCAGHGDSRTAAVEMLLAAIRSQLGMEAA